MTSGAGIYPSDNGAANVASSIADVEGIGRVRIYRRKGLKNIRITIEHDGSVRLSMPWYVPKSAGLRYLFSKKTWINKHQAGRFSGWKDGQKITGKYILKIIPSDIKKAKSIKKDGIFTVQLPKNVPEEDRTGLLDKHVNKLLREECETELVPLLRSIAESNKYKVKDVRVKKLKSRWGSCNQDKAITLNLTLARLPLELSEYVIYHELAHTRHLNHGKNFWEEVEKALPDYKERRKALRKFNPAAIS